MYLDKSRDDSGGERILSLIKRRGPQRISDISTALSITPEAARQQLARLADLSLVHAVAERQGVGRPAREWALTDAGHARFPDRHAELTLQLIEAVRAEFGERAVDRMIAQRESAMRRAYADGLKAAGSLSARVARLAEIRSREGYMAEAISDGAGWLLVENHCPICAAAEACQNFCRSEFDVFRDVLGAGVTIERTEHLLAGARRCAYRISETKGAVHDVARRDAGKRTHTAAKTRDARRRPADSLSADS
jgi:predicted ArsR family transcriptional regulator